MDRVFLPESIVRKLKYSVLIKPFKITPNKRGNPALYAEIKFILNPVYFPGLIIIHSLWANDRFVSGKILQYAFRGMA